MTSWQFYRLQLNATHTHLHSGVVYMLLVDETER